MVIGANALGPTVMEKHFTLRRSDGGGDWAFSLEPDEFTAIGVECDRAWQSHGIITYGGTSAELKSREHRRSLYIGRDLAAGTVLSRDNVRIVRPGFGLPPKHLEAVLGRRIARDAAAGTPLTWDLLS